MRKTLWRKNIYITLVYLIRVRSLVVCILSFIISAQFHRKSDLLPHKVFTFVAFSIRLYIFQKCLLVSAFFSFFFSISVCFRPCWLFSPTFFFWRLFFIIFFSFFFRHSSRKRWKVLRFLVLKLSFTRLLFFTSRLLWIFKNRFSFSDFIARFRNFFLCFLMLFPSKNEIRHSANILIFAVNELLFSFCRGFFFFFFFFFK